MHPHHPGHAAFVAVVALLGCQAAESPRAIEGPPELPRLSGPLLEERCDQIKETAAARGITNPLVIAGIANHETHLVQCLSEWPIHCAGPHSDECGGAVLAGSGDGPCSARAGGLGMFQFDAGNYDQTLAAYGHDILDVAGNIDAGIDIIIHKVRVCQHTAALAPTDAAAIDFINRATPGTADYEAYISTMASCYNGCQPHYTSCSHQGMRNNYKAGVQDLLDALGEAYWTTSADDDAAPSASSARIGMNADGRLELFALADDGSLAHRWQPEPSHAFEGWGDLGGALAGAPVVGAAADGRLEVFAIGGDGSLAHRWQVAAGTWSDDFERVGGEELELVGEPAVARNADGRLEVFVRSTDGRLVHTWQSAANAPFVAQWAAFGEHVASDPVLATNRDGRLEVFVRGDDDALHHSWQLEPSAGWSEWSTQGGTLTDAPFLGTNADGRLELFHVDPSGVIQHKWQQGGAGWVDEWSELPGSGFVGTPVVGSNDDGRMELVARTESGELQHIWQSAPDREFVGAWESFGDDARGDPQIARNADGRLEVFVQRGDGRLWHRWQLAPSSGWSEWDGFAGSIAEF